MREFLRDSFLSIVGSFREATPRTHFLNGHYISPGLDWKSDRKKFLELLDLLASEYRLISPEQALSDLRQNQRVQICLTFDDGFKDIVDVIAPALDRANVKALFFINPAYLGFTGDDALRVLKERYATNVKKSFLSSSDLKYLVRQGHIIGSHGLTHMRLNTDDRGLLIQEISSSKSELEAITNKSCDCFAFPFGGRNDLSVEALQIAKEIYSYIFSSVAGKDLFTFDNYVINRRHFEGNWKFTHLRYFLSVRGR
jgi:peptidoglycan/xylan/chitin deacetylase (PgdA/CDA1 family)